MVYGALTVGNRQGRSCILLTGCSRRERFRFSLTVSRRQERFGFCLMVGDRRGKFPWRQMKNWHRRSSLTALTVRNQSLTDFRQGKWTFPVSSFLTAYPWRLPSRITFPDGISHFPDTVRKEISWGSGWTTICAVNIAKMDHLDHIQPACQVL